MRASRSCCSPRTKPTISACGVDNTTPYVKDGINDYIVHGIREAVNPEPVGTKAAAHYVLSLGPGERATVDLPFPEPDIVAARRTPFGNGFGHTFARCR